jgi:hypothetical protein
MTKLSFLQAYLLLQICALVIHCLAVEYSGFQASCHSMYKNSVIKRLARKKEACVEAYNCTEF